MGVQSEAAGAMTGDAASPPPASGRPTGRWRDEAGLALVFLTRLPWPGPLPGDRPLMDAAWAFPAVGAAVGMLAAAGFWIADGLGLPVTVAALVAIGVAALATGALHEDGLADLADGFGGGRDAEATRRIMRDSRIGGYGALALILVVGAKAAGLAALPDVEAAAAALVAAHALGRAVIPALAHLLPPAAADGRGRAAGRPDAGGALWAAGIGLGIAVLALPGGIGVAAGLAAAAAAAAIGWLAMRRIGGTTGDVFGAAEQAAETAALLAIVSYLAI